MRLELLIEIRRTIAGASKAVAWWSTFAASRRSARTPASSRAGRRPRPSRKGAPSRRGRPTVQASWNDAFGAALHGRLVRALLGVVREYEALKRRRGVLDYLDLLLKARNALRDNESVRRYFRRRFRFVLIDEFQDTDPLQIEIATLLAGAAAGGLVVVGDAKQSIYRFRRADVRLFKRHTSEAAKTRGSGGTSPDAELPRPPRDPAFREPGFLRADRGIGRRGAGRVRADRAPARACSEEPSVIALRFQCPLRVRRRSARGGGRRSRQRTWRAWLEGASRCAIPIPANADRAGPATS